MKFSKGMKTFTALSACSLGAVPAAYAADSLQEIFDEAKLYGGFRLRYENVSDDSNLKDADALTLRTNLGINTGEYQGFSLTGEFEDSRHVFGVDDYSVPPSGYKVGQYSVIPDPETTEVSQAYLQYKGYGLTLKGGRQFIALDDQRFVGTVGWRQDWQSFDAFTANYKVNEALNLYYAYMDKRNRIFADDADVDSSDNLFNVSYNTAIGKFVGYAYLLEATDGINNDLDTYGVYYTGDYQSNDWKLTYGAQYATQDSKRGGTKNSADYYRLEGAAIVSGINFSLSWEVLGSDNGQYGFATPLATLHKFDGWADKFLATPVQGLEDFQVAVKAPLLGGNLVIAYHDYNADNQSNGVDDLGSEIDAEFVIPVVDKVKAGIKYASYDAGDTGFDTDKLWVWVQFSF